MSFSISASGKPSEVSRELQTAYDALRLAANQITAKDDQVESISVTLSGGTGEHGGSANINVYLTPKVVPAAESQESTKEEALPVAALPAE